MQRVDNAGGGDVALERVLAPRRPTEDHVELAAPCRWLVDRPLVLMLDPPGNKISGHSLVRRQGRPQ
jgi:hypothetical protein